MRTQEAFEDATALRFLFFFGKHQCKSICLKQDRYVYDV